MKLNDLTKAIGVGSKAVDDIHYSGEEQAQNINKRHEIDMSSDSWLSKNIRPLTLIFLLLCQGALIVGWLLGVEVDAVLTGQIGTLLFGAFGFYFNSKKGERIAEKNAKANIQITKLELKAKRKEERRKRKLERNNN